MQFKSLSDKTFDVLNITFLITVVGIILYPLIFVISASISNPILVGSGEMWLFPKDVTFEGYKRIFQNERIWRGYLNTIFYTTLGTVIHLSLLLPAAYALSRKQALFRKPILWYILITMLFNGGMIPTYLLVNSLGMVDTFWAIVIPGALNAWSVIVARAFFTQNVPEPLVEAAEIDGASNFYTFFKIALPLSAPIIAVMALFHGVGLWNQYFNALIYLTSQELYPLQLILREILIINQMDSGMMTDNLGNMEAIAQQAQTAELLKYGVIIVSTLPLILIYPFLQRYFLRGILVGSIKE